MHYRLYVTTFETSKGTKIYGGKRHSPYDNPNSDTYRGSGVHIQRAMKKYGASCIKSILWSKDFETIDLLKEAEELLIDVLMESFDNCTNLVKGGYGGNSYYNPEDNPALGKKRSDVARKNMSISAQSRTYTEEGLRRRQEATRRMVESRKQPDFSGSKNPAAKKVVVDGRQFSTLTECGKFYGIDKSTVFGRIKSTTKKWENWNYANVG